VYNTARQQPAISNPVKILICRRLLTVWGSSTAMNKSVTVRIRPQLIKGTTENRVEMNESDKNKNSGSASG
jgi:hypothetical protein